MASHGPLQSRRRRQIWPRSPARPVGDGFPHLRRHCGRTRPGNPGGARQDVAEPPAARYRQLLCRGHPRHAAAAAARSISTTCCRASASVSTRCWRRSSGSPSTTRPISARSIAAASWRCAKGQWEAAAALGMTKARAFHRIMLPQAMRIVMPALGNYFISLFKDTALASVVTVQELTVHRADHLGAFLPVLHPLYGDRHSLSRRRLSRRLVRALARETDVAGLSSEERRR